MVFRIPLFAKASIRRGAHFANDSVDDSDRGDNEILNVKIHESRFEEVDQLKTNNQPAFDGLQIGSIASQANLFWLGCSHMQKPMAIDSSC